MNSNQQKILINDTQRIGESLSGQLHILSGKTLLLTGANGVVGSFIAQTINTLNSRYLKNRPVHCVFVTHHKVFPDSKIGNLLGEKNFTFITADITKNFNIFKAPNYIIHCASYASPKIYLAKPVETLEANSIGTKHMLDLAKKYNVKNMMFISSGSVYGEGRLGEGPFTEEHCGYVSPLDIRSVYSESKRFGEMLCTIYSRNFHVPTNIARLSNMYGPGFNLNDGRAIPDFFNQAITTKKIEVNGNPNATRAYIYISDAIEAFFRILLNGKSGEAYNVSSEKSYSMVQIAQKIASLYPPCKVLTKIDKAKPYLSGSIVHTVVSSLKIRKELGWKQKIDMAEGLRNLKLWYKIG